MAAPPPRGVKCAAPGRGAAPGRASARVIILVLSYGWDLSREPGPNTGENLVLDSGFGVAEPGLDGVSLWLRCCFQFVLEAETLFPRGALGILATLALLQC
jgi:hypothetical protein|eukprot:CAMPEP_0174312922 /NCGR_PEP_ID=MMETSP0810-20121108/4625_1 /TAXON_ID=73025 ORGANISM="Eutreptiella gymnastica-like, Strain CCMP1594" /NCGR_SAMPLE_ID=MMETSP0810 /ASSEMBLY_ACC=CAM_ASM_000659 /LENGTH=100 /DNA_ID=CAMNT_0015421501 /DNA_START=138 /DNA_END=440 /DNA_ORIENTATION=-